MRSATQLSRSHFGKISGTVTDFAVVFADQVPLGFNLPRTMAWPSHGEIGEPELPR